MAAASQAASGEFDSRHLLQKIPDCHTIGNFFILCEFISRLIPKKIYDFPSPAPTYKNTRFFSGVFYLRFSVTCSNFKNTRFFRVFLLTNSALYKKPFPFRFFSQWIKAQKKFSAFDKAFPLLHFAQRKIQQKCSAISWLPLASFCSTQNSAKMFSHFVDSPRGEAVNGVD